jgi:hypothetical protein
MKEVPERIPTNSRRYGGHLVRRRGKVAYYYCDNCGKLVGSGDAFLGIAPSLKIFCSKECETKFFPKRTVWIVSAIIFISWIVYFTR